MDLLGRVSNFKQLTVGATLKGRKFTLFSCTSTTDAILTSLYLRGACRGGHASDAGHTAVVLGRCRSETGACLYCTGSIQG